MKKGLIVVSLLSAIVSAQAKNYKGAELYSNDSVLYGRFEMLLQAAPGSGQLSTFFLYRNSSELNTTLWEEIDLEIFGKDSNSFQSNVIIEKIEGKRLTTEIVHTTPFSVRNFHKYVIEWTPNSICWYVDDSLYRTENDYAMVCNHHMSIRLNHWAANLTDWVGAFDKAILPQYQKVDYIKYSSYTPGKGDNGSNFTFQWKDDFSSLDASRWSKANWTFAENLTDFLPENVYTEDGNLGLKHFAKVEENSTRMVFPYCIIHTEIGVGMFIKLYA